MDLLSLLVALQAQMASISSQLNDAQAAVAGAVKAATDPLDQKIADLQAQVDDLTAKLAAAQQPPAPPAPSASDIDAAVKAATDPLNAKIAELQAQVDGIPAQISAAIEAFKAQVKAKVDADLGDLDGLLAPVVAS